MPSAPAMTTTPSMRRAPNDSACACRSPKRARATPCPQSPQQEQPSLFLGRASVSRANSSSSSSSSHRRASLRMAKLSASQPSSTTSNTESWDDAPPSRHARPAGHNHAATSPCRSPTHKAHHQWGTKVIRRREMSVPLLSQTLSHVSLSQSTPPYDSELSPDAMTRAAPSSSPPLMDTPETVVVETPRRLLGLRRLKTPAPLETTRELAAAAAGGGGYPNTAPMPVINSLLGSPFDSKARLYPLELQSPTWLAKPQKGDVPRWSADWLEEREDELPELHESSHVPALKGDLSAEDSVGSRTSVSSYFSSERHAPRPPSRPSVVGIWDGDTTFYDQDDIATPHRQLFNRPRLNESIRLSMSMLQSSPGNTSPLMDKRPFPSPTGSSNEAATTRPLSLSRIPSTSSSTSLEDEPDRSPWIESGLVTASARNHDRIRSGPFHNELLPIPVDSLQRRTSDPGQSSGDAFAVFLARCGGDRATRSEMASHDRSSPAAPGSSSEANDMELELSPLRSATQRAIPPVPHRSGSAPLLQQFTLMSRLEKLKTGFKGDSDKSTTPQRGPTQPSRPSIRRGVTAPQVPSIPSFGTPISQLFGNDKPSPAAFASAGLVKKRGGRKSNPLNSVKTTRHWSPMPATTSGRSSTPRTDRDPTPTATGTQPNAPSRGPLPGSTARHSDHCEVLTHDFLEDTDEDDVSPIRPMRQNFRRSLPSSSHHRRVSSSATSDVMASPATRRRGHARMPSTASSIGTSKGLRRKSSSMFNSGASITSDNENPSPATPTKSLPFASVVQQKISGITTPSPTLNARYPFTRRMSVASINSVETNSPTATPLVTGRIRTLSRPGPIPRASNPMLGSAFRAHAVGGPGATTLGMGSSQAERYVPKDARAAGAGRFERDFTLVQALGNGEFSSVWKVCSKSNPDEVWAVKTGRPYTGYKNRLRQLEEVTILRVLGEQQHPNILRFVDSWEQSGKLYIRTELHELGDLSGFLARLSDQGGLDEGRVWKMMAELTSALQHIHSHGVLHLDFKPSNVLITGEGSLKVADFGLSVFVKKNHSGVRNDDDDNNGYNNDYDDNYDERRGLVLDRDFEGDREYLCPEALRDAAPGPGADIFSLGIMMLEAALNIVLPSNGDAWIKLRNDDFSDLDDHYAIRGDDVGVPPVLPGESPTPVVSDVVILTIKGMMAAEPGQRTTLEQILSLEPLRRARAAMEGLALAGGRTAGPALADEDEGWIEYVLGEVV